MSINKKELKENMENKYEFLILIQGSMYACGYDYDGYYCFKWSEDFKTLEEKYMFCSYPDYEKFVFLLIQENKEAKCMNSDFNLYECKSRYTIDKLRLELEHGYEFMLTYSTEWETLEFSNTKTLNMICYTSKTVKKAICQEFSSVDELLKNGNINGEYLPELIEKFNQYTGKIGKDLFVKRK